MDIVSNASMLQLFSEAGMARLFFSANACRAAVEVLLSRKVECLDCDSVLLLG